MRQHFHSAVCNVWTRPSIGPRVELLRTVLGERSELGGEIGVALEVAVPCRLDPHVPERAAARARGQRAGGVTAGLPAVPAAEGAEEATHRTSLGRRLSRVNFT